ncbi:NADP-dependent oxidoreductase [Mycolicibacterium thermoresistibile]
MPGGAAMKAVGHTEFGGPDVLREIELPTPVAGPGEVLVRVHAAAVNPADTVRRSGMLAKAMRSETPPYVQGMDIAGELAAIGPGTQTDLAVGDRVMGIVIPRGAHGGYAEYVALPADSVVAVPAGAELVAAATLPMNGLTAQLTLDMLALRPGQTLGVTGAAGGYGGYVVQLAKADGLTVIADAGAADRALVTQLGADTVVDRGDDVASRFREVAPGGVDGLADGAVLTEKAVPAVKAAGGFASLRRYRGSPADGLTHHDVSVLEYATRRDKLDRLRVLVEQGRVTLRVAEAFPAARADEAHRRLEAGGTRGRLVLTFD